MAPSRAARLLLALLSSSYPFASSSPASSAARPAHHTTTQQDNDTTAQQDEPLLLDLSQLAYSNLDGAGPDSSKPSLIVYSKVATQAHEDADLDLQISAQSIHNNEYTPYDSSRNVNSGANRQVGVLNLQRGSNADLHFQFVKAGTSTPAQVQQTYVTIFIPDGVESVSVTQYQEVCFPSNSVVRQDLGAGDRQMFFVADNTFQAAGELKAPPSDASKLRPEEEARAVTFLFEKASVFPVLIRTTEAGEGPLGVDFAFSGDAPEECKPGPFTVPNCGEDDEWDDWKVQWCCRHKAIACDHTTVTTGTETSVTTTTVTSATATTVTDTSTTKPPLTTKPSTTTATRTTTKKSPMTTKPSKDEEDEDDRDGTPKPTPKPAEEDDDWDDDDDDEDDDNAAPAPTPEATPAPPDDGWEVHDGSQSDGADDGKTSPDEKDKGWSVQLGDYCTGDVLGAAQQEWCCENEKVGCTESRTLTDSLDAAAAGAAAIPDRAASADAGPPEQLFRCATGVRGVDPLRDWSEMKISWCCRWRGVACRGGERARIQVKAESGQPKGLPAAGVGPWAAAAWAACASAAALLGAVAVLRAPRWAGGRGWAPLDGGLGAFGRGRPLVAGDGPGLAD